MFLTQGARLPPRDRSFDRNKQHRAALAHHPTNAAYPRRAVCLGTCLHLLIAGSFSRTEFAKPRQPRSTATRRTHRFCVQDPRSGPSVGRPSRQNNTQQRDTTLTNDEQCSLVSADLAVVIRRPVWSPRRSCQSQRPRPSPGGQTLRDGQLSELLRSGRVDRVWHPPAPPSRTATQLGTAGWAWLGIPSRSTAAGLPCGRTARSTECHTRGLHRAEPVWPTFELGPQAWVQGRGASMTKPR